MNLIKKNNMVKKILVFLFVGLLLVLGCASPTPDGNLRYSYLPDGRMVLLQSSGEDKPVEFLDANLELVVRETLESLNTLAAGETIYTKDLEEIVYLEASGRDITDLTGIENCINLQFIDLMYNNVSDTSPIAVLPGATIINQDEKGSEIGRYTSLYMTLAFNQIKDITPLSSLASVDFLSIDLSGNGISDLTSLSNLSGLQHLYLQYNDIEDVSALRELSNLTVLALGENRIEDVSALAGCSLLDSLSLWNNEITDISPLTVLDRLVSLSLDRNLISELPSLSGKWQQMHTLILSYNQLRDASETKNLPAFCEVILEGNPLE